MEQAWGPAPPPAQWYQGRKEEEQKQVPPSTARFHRKQEGKENRKKVGETMGFADD